ncbi:hypothetical protein H9X78_05800 [Clostridium saudiense]|nr:hypothetical protein [Clostridium saudiense]MBM6860008.1 hypothetical protein [Clostridium saudiense]
MRIDKQNISLAVFLTLLLTYIYVVHNDNSVIYGFPFGHTTIYPAATTFTSSFNINILLALLDFILMYLTISLVKRGWNKLISNRK